MKRYLEVTDKINVVSRAGAAKQTRKSDMEKWSSGRNRDGMSDIFRGLDGHLIETHWNRAEFIGWRKWPLVVFGLPGLLSIREHY